MNRGNKGVLAILSPHFDDAVLGCSSYLSRIARNFDRVHVVTMITKSAWAPGLAGHDVKKVSKTRAKEDRTAMKSILGSHMRVNLGGIDAPLRGVKNVTAKKRLGPGETRLARLVYASLKKIKPSFIVAPLGIKHIDHAAAVSGASRYIRESGCSAVFYEELPVAGTATSNEITGRAIKTGGMSGLRLYPFYVKTGVKTKLKALSFYPSQIRGEDKNAVFSHLKKLNGFDRLWKGK